MYRDGPRARPSATESGEEGIMRRIDRPRGLVVSTATRADLRDMARCHAAAFPGEFLTALGAGLLKELYGHLARDPEGICLVARDGRGHLLGLVAGGAPAARARFIRRRVPRHFVTLLVRALGDPSVRARMLLHARSLISGMFRKSEVRRSDSPSPVAHAALLSICTDPAARGMGVGRLLMDAFETVAARSGYAAARLSVRPHNAEAIALYLRAGWRIVREEPGGIYFEKALPSGKETA